MDHLLVSLRFEYKWLFLWMNLSAYKGGKVIILCLFTWFFKLLNGVMVQNHERLWEKKTGCSVVIFCAWHEI